MKIGILRGLLLVLGLVLAGCAAPRIAGKTVSGVANGTMEVVGGATKMVTAPLR